MFFFLNRFGSSQIESKNLNFFDVTQFDVQQQTKNVIFEYNSDRFENVQTRQIRNLLTHLIPSLRQS